jgi:hypothetical protein
VDLTHTRYGAARTALILFLGVSLVGCAGQGGAGYQEAPPLAAPAGFQPAATPPVQFASAPAAAPMQVAQANVGPAPMQVAQANVASAPPQPQSATSADPWPRQLDLANGTVLVYQPQVQSWQGSRLDFRSAVALLPQGGNGAETYGVIFGTAMTTVDKFSRTVYLNEVSVYEIKFPTLPDNGRMYLAGIKQSLPGAMASMSLDRLQASLAASGTVNPPPVQVNNTPPNILVSYGPALLIDIAGAPVVKQVPDARFERVINTQAFIARTRFGSTWYMRVYDGWLSAPDVVAGPWTLADRAPAGMDDVAQRLKKAGTVDLLDGGPNATPKPSLANGVPRIFVATTPSELIVFKGQPNFISVAGTNLLWATNTAGDVFIDNTNSYYYILIAGRWYTAPAINGPWSFVPPNGLPPDFSRIPAGSPAAVVLASVAGTPQAQEALIANSIPQTAAVSRIDGPAFAPTFDGTPQFAPVIGTPLQYVQNSATPIIQVNADTYYAVKGGVWFTATAVNGPWFVATSVPDVIYTIPPASPLHYVTYVRVYSATPTTVYVGYTPGYLGTVVAPGGVVVYGTGYAYTPWIGNVYYPPPVTYGIAAAPVYNPAVGFTFGMALGMSAAYMAAPYWGGAYYHPGYWGYPCCGSASANVYRNWGTGVSYGTRSWYDSGGTYGTSAAGYYNNRGTQGYYAGGRSYNPYTGQGNAYASRTAATPGGATGSVTRGATYNTQTGERAYGSSGSVTGPGGSSVSRTASDAAGPGYALHNSSTTTYNAKTGQTNTWNNGVPSSNNHYGDTNGNVARSTSDGGWQQHTSSGWQNSADASSWASKEQQARNTGDARTSAYTGNSGGWDRSGSGDASRFGGGSGSSWGDRFSSGGGGYGDRFGGDSGWGDRYSGSSFADRFGGGRFGGGRFGGFRR